MPQHVDTAADVLSSSQEGAVRRLTLHRPNALNTFDRALQQALRTAVDAASADPSVRCLVITGSGRAFSAGADIELDDLDPSTKLAPRTDEELRLRYNPTIRTLRTMGKPVLAAVNGPAVGLGCALAAACDQVIAADTAWFSLAFAQVGLTLDAGASLSIGARIGFGRATQMAMLGRRVDAATALAWGLVDEVVAPEEFDGRVADLAQTLADGPTAAFAATKRSLNTALLSRLDAAFESEIDGQTRLVDTADFREGAAAFAARRAPAFVGDGAPASAD